MTNIISERMFTGGHGMNPKYLGVTRMLDYETENIQKLIEERKWKELPEYERIKAVYDFVRDEILFGYNVDDTVPASRVLRDGYGQCNTKGTAVHGSAQGM